MSSMRRSDREIPIHEAAELLRTSEYGVLSTASEDGQPYGVPLSYVYRNGSIYFHCALTGHKLDNIGKNPLVSFCVVGKTQVLPDKFATEYESAIACGAASEIFGSERHDALLWLLDKYCPGYRAEGEQYIAQKNGAMKVFKIEVKQISGKARR